MLSPVRTVYALLGLAAIGLGVVGWIKKEDLRISGVAALYAGTGCSVLAMVIVLIAWRKFWADGTGNFIAAQPRIAYIPSQACHEHLR